MVLDKFFRDLGKGQREKIEAVACDGAKGYLSSIQQYAKNALIVLDHFYVKKYLNDALDTIRKEELKIARQKKDTELSEILHCNKTFILMQNRLTNKKQDLLERVAGLNGWIYRAMLLKEQFLSIYSDQHTAMRALMKTGPTNQLKDYEKKA